MALKTLLFILSFFEDKLIEMKNEEIINFINNLGKNDLFNDKEMTQKFKREVNQYSLYENLRQRFKKELDIIQKISKKHIIPKEYYDFESKYFIKESGKYIMVYYEI